MLEQTATPTISAYSNYSKSQNCGSWNVHYCNPGLGPWSDSLDWDWEVTQHCFQGVWGVRAKIGVVTSSHSNHVWAEESGLDRGASAINSQEALGSQHRGIESAVKPQSTSTVWTMLCRRSCTTALGTKLNFALRKCTSNLHINFKQPIMYPTVGCIYISGSLVL